MPEVTQAFLEEFGRTVEQARSLRGWSLKTLGIEALGRDNAAAFLSGIQKGKRRIGSATAGKLITALDLDKQLLDPFLAGGDPKEPEETREDREAETLIRMAEGDAGAPPAAEALMIALAYEFAQGSHVDLMTAYKGLRAALESAAEIKRRGELPQNTGEQLQAVMRRVAELNDLGQREEAARELDAAMARVKAEAERLDAEREVIFNAQLDQDRILNRPASMAMRLVDQIKATTQPESRFLELYYLYSDRMVRNLNNRPHFDIDVTFRLAEALKELARTPAERCLALFSVGNVLVTLGEREGSPARLRKAIQVLRRAAECWQQHRQPLLQGCALSKLGAALGIMGVLESNPAHLKQAITTLRMALPLVPRSRAAADWAEIQMNLGNTLRVLGELRKSVEIAEEAVAAYRLALLEFERDRAPLNWSEAQMNLATALSTLGVLEKSGARLAEAAEAFLEASEDSTRDRMPLVWAVNHGNLCRVELERYDIEPKSSRLDAAEAHLADARSVFLELDAVAHLDWADSMASEIAKRRAG